ncbi:MAG: hypothetical protein RR696_05335 [Clostridia bacterium]
MKKIVVVIMALTIVFAITSSAMATGTPFNIVTDSTSVLQTGCSVAKKTGAHWFIRLNEETSNLSATHRAVVRVHKGAQSISATWVYGGPNETDRLYSASYQKEVTGISFRGRMDDRDTGTLEFHGTFHHSYGF